MSTLDYIAPDDVETVRDKVDRRAGRFVRDWETGEIEIEAVREFACYAPSIFQLAAAQAHLTINRIRTERGEHDA